MLTSETILNDRYRLQEQLCENPVRQTWLAQDLQSEEQVVVKLLAQGGITGWQDIKLFEREAQILQQLDHPHIIKYRDYFAVDEQTLWFGLVTDYISGDSLKNWLDQGYRFSEKQVRHIAQEVLAILEFLHGLPSPVLHRDIKPSNLMWSGEKEVYLIDFGSVQCPSVTPGSTFTVVGTYGYTPLEQFGGKAVPASDLYGLGATLIHLLTGIAPADLPQQNLQLQFRQHLGTQVDPLFINWLEKLTQPSLEKRFIHVQEALDALHMGMDIPVSPQENIARLSKSPEQLVIEIPSQFDIEIVKPLIHQLKRLKVKLKHKFTQWVSRFHKLDQAKKRQIGSGIMLALAIFFVLDFWLYGSLGWYMSRIISRIISIPFELMIFALPFLFIVALILASIRQGKYGEQVQVYLDRGGFEILWRSPQGTQREIGELNQIEDILVTSIRNPSGHYRSALMMTTNIPRKLPFFGAQTKEYLFGHQLKTSELNWLAQEIQDWLEIQGL